MIIAKIQGGLGNQMFEYAAGRRLAHANGEELKLDIFGYQKSDLPYRCYELDAYNIRATIAGETEIGRLKRAGIRKLTDKIKPFRFRRHIREAGYHFDRRILELKGEKYLDGYWQGEKYFRDIADIIRQEFTLKNGLGETARKWEKEISAANAVSIHIRRGDYLSPKFAGIFRVLEPEWYLSAIKIITEQVEDPIFFIFTDDPDWAKNNLQFNKTEKFVSGRGISNQEELILMSRCRHHIIANSSFSWWGGWLNSNPEKIVIAPRAWFKSGLYDEKDIIPAGWQTF